MQGIRITPEPDWSVDADLLSIDTPPETMWFCTELGSCGQTPRFVYVGDRPCVLLYEQPVEESIPANAQPPIVFYRFQTEAIDARFHCIGDQWVVENRFCPDDPDNWLNCVIRKGRGFEVCLRWVEKAWFEKIRSICSAWNDPLDIEHDALQGAKSVEYAWRRGGPPRGRAIFLVSRISEDDYIFSDGTLFYYAHIMNPWEWDSRYDEARWQTYRRLEDLLIRHCFGNRSLVPLDYLPMAFSSFIRHHLPTMDFVWFMRAREAEYRGTVFLIARYGDFRGHPGDVKSLELLVGDGEADPAVRKLTLISGEQNEIFDWLKASENRKEIIQTARRMLAEYEAASVARNRS